MSHDVLSQDSDRHARPLGCCGQVRRGHCWQGMDTRLERSKLTSWSDLHTIVGVLLPAECLSNLLRPGRQEHSSWL